MFMGECEGERIEEELVNYFPTRFHLLTIFSLERPIYVSISSSRVNCTKTLEFFGKNAIRRH
jgi:hypothetical protein